MSGQGRPSGDRPPTDEEILARLRRIMAEADPVPGPLLGAARAVFGLRDLDARVAELVRDSLVDSPVTAVRGDGPRLLSFEAGDVVIECGVTGPAGGGDGIGPRNRGAPEMPVAPAAPH